MKTNNRKMIGLLLTAVAAFALVAPSMGIVAPAAAQGPDAEPGDPTSLDDDLAFACATVDIVGEALGQRSDFCADLGCPRCPPPCATSIVSDAKTRWTHYAQNNLPPASTGAGGANGFRLPAVSTPTYTNWIASGNIPASTWGPNPTPQYIWKEAGISNGGYGNAPLQAVTRLPVMFEREFNGCLVAAQPAVLKIHGDNNFLVVFNGLPIGPATTSTHCGRLHFEGAPSASCTTNVKSIPVTLLPGGATNRLVIYAWNTVAGGMEAPNPAMIQFKLDY